MFFDFLRTLFKLLCVVDLHHDFLLLLVAPSPLSSAPVTCVTQIQEVPSFLCPTPP